MFSKIIVTLILRSKLDVSIGRLSVICSLVGKKHVWGLLKINPESIVALDLPKIQEELVMLKGFKRTYAKSPDLVYVLSVKSLWNMLNYYMEYGKQDEVTSMWNHIVELECEDLFIWDLIYPMFVEDDGYQFFVDKHINIFGDETKRFSKLKMLASCCRLPAKSYAVIESKIEDTSGSQKVLEVISDMVPEYAFY